MWVGGFAAYVGVWICDLSFFQVMWVCGYVIYVGFFPDYVGTRRSTATTAWPSPQA
jgi:hypothetical protein